jgi:hypothetical protein
MRSLQQHLDNSKRALHKRLLQMAQHGFCAERVAVGATYRQLACTTLRQEFQE